MLPDPDMTEALLDWCERDRIRRTLLAARPGLARRLILEEGRPLIRIPTSDGRALLVAKTAEGQAARWVVGVPGRPEPTLHEPRSCAELVRLVLDELGPPRDGADGASRIDAELTDGSVPRP